MISVSERKFISGNQRMFFYSLFTTASTYEIQTLSKQEIGLLYKK